MRRVNPESSVMEWRNNQVPIAADVKLGAAVTIHHQDLVNLYGCAIGDQSKVRPFVEIQRGVVVGRCCKISSHSFICEGVTIEDEVFIGHGVMFVNDRYPRATTDGQLQAEGDWRVIPTLIKRGASIGSGAVIMCGVTVGQRGMVGAGVVVSHDVPDHPIVVGVSASVIGDARERRGPPVT
jgi:acetyltransferase-like isoleucine patch superfamily enzyme